MSCDPNDLLASSRCLLVMNERQLLASWALLVCGSEPPPPSDDGRILEDGTDRDIEDGTRRIIES